MEACRALLFLCALSTAYGVEDICELPAVTGRCRAAIRRYFFNSKSNQCEVFIYGGCEGNENNFETVDDCIESCGKPKITPPIDICDLPAEPGPCSDYDGRYFFNSKTGRCDKFTYGGCKGNENNFVRLEDCRETCEIPENICDLPADVGSCDGVEGRYFFNPFIGRCDKFTYGGCGGNANNFVTLDDCRETCEAPVGCPLEEVDKCILQCGSKDHTPVKGTECTGCQCFDPCAVILCIFGTTCVRQESDCGRKVCPIEAVCRPVNPCPFDPPLTDKHGQPLTCDVDAQDCPKESICVSSIPSPVCCPDCLEEDFIACIQKCTDEDLAPVKGTECNTCQCVDPCVSILCKLGSTCVKQVSDCSGDNCPLEGVCRPVNPCEFGSPLTDRFGQELKCDIGSQDCPFGTSCVPSLTFAVCCADNCDIKTQDSCVRKCLKSGEAPIASTLCTDCQCWNPCVVVKCAQGTTCQLVQDKCRREPCAPRPVCVKDCSLKEIDACGNKCLSIGEVPVTGSECSGCLCRKVCALAICEKGYKCVAKKVDCARAPCFPVPECVPGTRWIFDPDLDLCKPVEHGRSCSEEFFDCFEDCRDANQNCPQVRCKECKNGNLRDIRGCNGCAPTDTCDLPADPGPCEASIERFFFNFNSRQCETFQYGGCEGNANNFESFDQCTRHCEICPVVDCFPGTFCPLGFHLTENRCDTCKCLTASDICNMDVDQGPCKDSEDLRFYFNSISGKCEPFIYGGCLGNRNNFETFSECEDFCKPTFCPKIICALYCKYGFRTNKEGCQVCKCKRTPCKYGRPLRRKGRELNCGFVLEPDVCPSGSSCLTDPADRFGVCCRDSPRKRKNRRKNKNKW